MRNLKPTTGSDFIRTSEERWKRTFWFRMLFEPRQQFSCLRKCDSYDDVGVVCAFEMVYLFWEISVEGVTDLTISILTDDRSFSTLALWYTTPLLKEPHCSLHSAFSIKSFSTLWFTHFATVLVEMRELIVWVAALFLTLRSDKQLCGVLSTMLWEGKLWNALCTGKLTTLPVSDSILISGHASPWPSASPQRQVTTSSCKAVILADFSRVVYQNMVDEMKWEV